MIIFFIKDIVKLPFFEFAWLGIPYQTVGVRSGKRAGITHLESLFSRLPNLDEWWLRENVWLGIVICSGGKAWNHASKSLFSLPACSPQRKRCDYGIPHPKACLMMNIVWLLRNCLVGDLLSAVRGAEEVVGCPLKKLGIILSKNLISSPDLFTRRFLVARVLISKLFGGFRYQWWAADVHPQILVIWDPNLGPWWRILSPLFKTIVIDGWGEEVWIDAPPKSPTCICTHICDLQPRAIVCAPQKVSFPDLFIRMQPPSHGDGILNVTILQNYWVDIVINRWRGGDGDLWRSLRFEIVW